MQTRRQFLALGVSLALPAGLRARQEPMKKDDPPAISPETQKAIDAGLQFLAKTQRQDGSFGSGQYQNEVGVTGLCGLAFLAGGHMPGQGPYGEVVSKIVKHLLGLQDAKGLIRNPRSGPSGVMYGHAHALQFLTAVHGQLSDTKEHAALLGVLEKGLKLILQTQSPKGGWRYQPMPQQEDVTHTALMLLVLRGFHDAGFTVPKAAVDRAVAYVKRCQEKTSGGYRYAEFGGPLRFSSTAIALAGLFQAGVTQGPEVEKGLAYLKKNRPRRGETFFFYGHHYAAQAMWQAGGAHRAEWYPIVRKELLETMPPRADGSWVDQYGPHLATAWACITLQLPLGY